MDVMTLAYQHTRAGRVKVHACLGKKTDPATGEEVDIWTPVATPFGVLARLRHVDEADAYGLRVAVQAMKGKPRAVDFDRGELARIGGTEICSRLLAAGLRVEGDGEKIAVKAFKAADPVREIVIVSRPGWHRLDGLPAPMFVTPGGEVFGAPGGYTLELASDARLPMPAKAGTLDGWREAVTEAVSVEDCPHWTLGVAAGFAGAVLALTGLDSCGCHFSGPSSAGKTTTQKEAASAWASPKIGAGLLQSMRTTENALERLAQGSSGTVLALDEMAHADGKAIARMIYSIAGGLGKARMTQHATLKGRYAWETFAVLSGECSLEQKVRHDGGQWLAGMAVRIPSIDVTGVNRLVPQSRLKAIAGIDQHYGHAGPAFVEHLIDEGYHLGPEILRNSVLAAARKLAGEGADGARNRAALPFALLLVAGELAKEFGLVPKTTKVAEAVAWAWGRFLGSSDADALDPDAQAIAQLQAWIAERWDVTIKDVEASSEATGRRLNNRESVGWYDATAVYIPTYKLSQAAGGGVSEQHLAAVIEGRGWLAKRENQKRRAVRRVPKVGKVQRYALSREAFGRSTEEQRFTAYQGGRS